MRMVTFLFAAALGLPLANDSLQAEDTANERAKTVGQEGLAEIAVEEQKSISFSEALRLASGENPQIAFADERINEAYAALRGVQTLWLPTIRAGVSYNKHEGPLQQSEGTMLDASRAATAAGLGVQASGTGSPAVPGVSAIFRTTDAFFLPRAAEHAVAARQDAATAVCHDLLLATAISYLDLLRAYQQQAIAEETLQHAQRLADLTATFARTGAGLQADADRAKAELAMRRNELTRAIEQAKVASARLAELIHHDPSQTLVPQESTIVAIDLVPRDVPVGQLVSQGLTQRPELAESRHLVAEATQRYQRERYAPLMPSVVLGLSGTGFGAGTGNDLASMRGRFDFDATAFWEVRNLGAGEAAAREGARSRVELERIRQVQLMDRVAREIVEARAQTESRRKQIPVAEEGIAAANEAYQRSIQRIAGGQGLPIETLQSIQALNQSRREYLRAVSDYDEAQFRLHRALGWPIPQ